MSKINILPEHLANKIAAGEVVQRPESVVKELLENAIDAKSQNISVFIKRAGKILIQVSDDGEGMSEEDAILSIHKHATSKINKFEDLEALHTLGFRGEALSSIVAVSQFELKTERYEDDLGTHIRFDDSQNIIVEKGSFAKGTSVIVKNLFFNTPARRNFLRSDSTELKHIVDTFNKIALSHYNIGFKLFIDDDLSFDYKGGTLVDRIEKIFADNMLDALIKVEERTELISINGYISKPTFLKKSKQDQYLFLNQRFVLNKQINHAVFNSYDDLLDKGDYPFFVLFLDIDPKQVDVNIHPSKLEVRFDDDRGIYNFVKAVIKKSLSSFDLVPNLSFNDNGITNHFSDERMQIGKAQQNLKGDFSDRPPSLAKTIRYSDDEIEKIFGTLDNLIEKTSNEDNNYLSASEQGNDSKTEISNQKIKTTPSTFHSFIIQLHDKYILSQIKSGMMIIDQHAAHERILYEKALNLFDANLPFSQMLVFPKTLEFDPAKFLIIKELDIFLSKLGFTIKFFSKNTIVIEGVPNDVKQGEEESILLEILEEYFTNQREKKIIDKKDNLAKSFSCRTAIKAGDRLSENEMRILIDQLFATSMPYVCPHGRPIVIKISIEEFDKRFGRT